MRPSTAATRRRSVRAAALVGAALLAAGPGIPAGHAATAEPLTDHSVSVTVVDVTPVTPAQTAAPQRMTVTLSLTNTTDQTLDQVRIDGDRSDPIQADSANPANTLTALDEDIAHPKPPDPSLVAPIRPLDGKPVLTALGAKSSTTVTFTTTTGTDVNAAGLCLCTDAIYPLYFTAHYLGPDGSDTLVGSGQTYVPAFGSTLPTKAEVSWVWPIIDRPHRITSDTVFVDDDLASSVSRGRLDRVLQVVENVAARGVSMTLVIDPDLIDELQVMSSGKYQVAVPGQPVRSGTGADAAAAWLQRLRNVLDEHPALEVQFTPYADPAAESLMRSGLSWSVSLSTAAAERVTAAMGGRTPTNQIAWPYGETLSADTLDTIHRNGASTVVLNDHTLPWRAGGIPEGLAQVQTLSGPVMAAVTSSTIQRFVGTTLAIGGAGTADLPLLTAEIAVRVVADPNRSHYVVVTPPRYIDPNVSVATRAIATTARTLWSKPTTVTQATQSLQPVDRGGMVAPKPGTDTLPALTIDTVRQVNERLPALTSMLVTPDATTTAALLSGLPAGVQRAESSSWLVQPTSDAITYVEVLAHALDSLEGGVFIIKPSSGTYTLASSNSPLPVALQNRLDVAVKVRVRISTVNDLPGFSARDIGVRQIAPRATVTLHIPVDVQRSGRFQVQAQLYTPNGATLGDPLFLSVRSTALGTIGVIITIVAGAVLVLALLVRLLRRFRGRGRTAEVEVPEPVAVP